MAKFWITAVDCLAGGWTPLCRSVVPDGDKEKEGVTLFKTKLAAINSIADVLEEQLASIRDGSRDLEDFGTDEVPEEVNVDDDLTFVFAGVTYQGILDEEPDVVTDGQTWTG